MGALRFAELVNFRVSFVFCFFYAVVIILRRATCCDIQSDTKMSIHDERISYSEYQIILRLAEVRKCHPQYNVTANQQIHLDVP